MSEIGRNMRCPCRSGLKYKHCCLGRREELALDVERTERVWGRMQGWAFKQFGDELGEALKEHMDARGIGTEDRPAMDDDLSVALCWLLIDRELAQVGGTPAQRYAELPELSRDERAMTRRIAQSRLGLQRVRDVVPGVWIDLENVLTGARVRVSSPNVSQEAVRWDVLLCRLMTGGPGPSLWGGAAFYEPEEEVELLAVLERIAGDHHLGAGPAALEEALRVGARELVCFVPGSRCVEKVPCTLEGDVVSFSEVSWSVRDPTFVLEELSRVPEFVAVGKTDDGKGFLFEWVVSRRDLIARRSAVPANAILFESSPLKPNDDGGLYELADVTSFGQFALRGRRLTFSGMSEARADAAIRLVELCLGDLGSDPTRSVRSFEDALSASRAEATGSSKYGRQAAAPSGDAPSWLMEQRLRELLYRRWVDEPIDCLGGLSPRAAAACGRYRNELESLLRGLEHRNALQRADRAPGPEVAWLRAELGLEVEPLAV